MAIPPDPLDPEGKTQRRCRACRRLLKDDEGLWHGTKIIDLKDPLIKCVDCDYQDYLGQYGGL